MNTDIDGSPILILSISEAETVTNMCYYIDHTDKLEDDEEVLYQKAERFLKDANQQMQIQKDS